MKSKTFSVIFKKISKAYAIALFSCLLFVLGSTLVPAQQAHAAGNTYYVAKNGSNSGSGTETSPWLTIKYAAIRAVAGDTVYVKNGTYNEQIWITSAEGARGGSAGYPVTIKAYPGHLPIIDGTGLPNVNGYMGLVTINVPYINLDGFEIRNNAAYSGVFVADTHNINLSNLNIHNVNWEGIQVGSSSNVVIDSVQVYNSVSSLQNESITLKATTNFEIKNSSIHDNKKEGINCKNGSSNGLIHDNDIYNIPSDGIYLETTGIAQSNISIYRNRIHTGSGNGIALGSELSSRAPQTGISIYNNLIYGNGRGLVAYPMNYLKTFSIINNTFYHNGYVEIQVYDPPQYQVNCAIRNNIIVPNPGRASGSILTANGPGGITIDHNLFYNSTEYNVLDIFGTDYVKADPQLISPSSDFRISSSSPAKDAAAWISVSSTDYVGTPRPQGLAYDVGAYEYAGSTSPTSPTYPTSPTAPTTGGLPNITTATVLPNGTSGVYYYQTLTASGGTGSYTWAISSGTLPPGLSLSSTGIISGVPATGGSAMTITVRLTDSAGAAGIKSLSIKIDGTVVSTPTTPPPSPPATTGGLPNITTATILPNGTSGVAYYQPLTASGGTGYYTWTVYSGALPPGLSLSSSGVISGTPTTGGSAMTVTIRLTDSAGAAGIKSLSIKIDGAVVSTPTTPPPSPPATTGGLPNITTATILPNGTSGVAYYQPLTASGGTSYYTWTVYSGALPPGLSLSSSGVISGTPTTGGSAMTVTIRLTDSAGAAGIKSLSIKIDGAVVSTPTTPPPSPPATTGGLPNITTATILPNGTSGVAYYQPLTASGGTGYYTWTVYSGALPPGLSLNSSGVISGTPTTGGSAMTVTIRLTDSAGAAGMKSLSIKIDGPVNTPAAAPAATGGLPSITTATVLPKGTVGASYYQPLTASGGTGLYTWTISAGALPAGLSLSRTGVISGTPTTAGSPVTITVRLTDSAGAAGAKSLSIAVSAN